MQGDDGTDRGRPLVSNRTMEIIVALVLLGGCAIVIHDSVRLGFGWREGEGPAPGYYPFWVATILGVSSLVNLVNALRGHAQADLPSALRSGVGRAGAQPDLRGAHRRPVVRAGCEHRHF
jgi:hypothetical protein